MTAPALVPVRSLGATGIARAERIYLDGFPEVERVPFDELFVDEVLAYADDGVRGLVVTHTLASTGWEFVRYFVAGERGRGVGSAMWRALVERLPGVRGIALDVENPDEAGVPVAEVELRHRRIAFYQRLGILLLPVRDYLPPHGGQGLPLCLMAWQRDGAIDVRGLLLDVYLYRYGLPATDPVVRHTLAASGL